MAKTKPKTSKKKSHSLPPEFEKMLKEIAARKLDDEKIGREQLSVICPELFLIGCVKCHVSYSGEGDSGGVDHISYVDINDVCIIEVPQKLLDAMETAVCYLLPGGFENNDGGYGEITIDIQNKKVKLEHNERVVDVEVSEQNFTY
jgi:hypothetical protein